MRRNKITAEDLLRDLAADPEYHSRIQARDKALAHFESELRIQERPIVDELKALGITVQSIWDLVNSENNYDSVILTLLKHLSGPHHPRIKEAIVRALIVPYSKSVPEVWEQFSAEFSQVPGDAAIEDPRMRGLRPALAFALAYLANRERLPQLLQIIKDCDDQELKKILEDRVAPLQRRPQSHSR